VDRLERASLLPSDWPAGGRGRLDWRCGQPREVVPCTPAVDPAEGSWWPGRKLHRCCRSSRSRCCRSSRSRWRCRGGRSRSPRSRDDEGTTPQDGGVVGELLEVSTARGRSLNVNK